MINSIEKINIQKDDLIFITYDMTAPSQFRRHLGEKLRPAFDLAQSKGAVMIVVPGDMMSIKKVPKPSFWIKILKSLLLL